MPRDHEARKRRRKERQLANIRLVRAYFSAFPCMDCGEGDPDLLEFDHTKGKKTANVSDLVMQAYSWERIFAEIAQCVTVCVSCHRKRTIRRRREWAK